MAMVKKFSKVSSLLDLLYKVALEQKFENCCLPLPIRGRLGAF